MEALRNALTRISGLINVTDDSYMLPNLLAARDDLRQAISELSEYDLEGSEDE